MPRVIACLLRHLPLLQVDCHHHTIGVTTITIFEILSVIIMFNILMITRWLTWRTCTPALSTTTGGPPTVSYHTKEKG